MVQLSPSLVISLHVTSRATPVKALSARAPVWRALQLTCLAPVLGGTDLIEDCPMAYRCSVSDYLSYNRWVLGPCFGELTWCRSIAMHWCYVSTSVPVSTRMSRGEAICSSRDEREYVPALVVEHSISIADGLETIPTCPTNASTGRRVASKPTLAEVWSCLFGHLGSPRDPCGSLGSTWGDSGASIGGLLGVQEYSQGPRAGPRSDLTWSIWICK